MPQALLGLPAILLLAWLFALCLSLSYLPRLALYLGTGASFPFLSRLWQSYWISPWD
jgi:hypothetical protein